MVCLCFEEIGEPFSVEPGWRKDVCAALPFEEEGEPERERASTGRDQWFDGSLADCLSVYLGTVA